MKPHQVIRKYDGIPIKSRVSLTEYTKTVRALMGLDPTNQTPLNRKIEACYRTNYHPVAAAYSLDVSEKGLVEVYE